MALIESGTRKKETATSSGGAFFSSHIFSLPPLKVQIIFWSIVVVGIAFDLWSKSVVFSWLEQKPGNSVPVIDGFLRLVMALNDGAAFGLFSGKSYLLALFSVVALILVCVLFLLSGKEPVMVHIALALFVAGICGNLWDRIFNDGLVRDFIDVTYWHGKHWPAFNVADSLLCIGLGLVILSSFRSLKRT